MGISNYIPNMAWPQLSNWLTDISQKLGNANFYNGEFSPNITPLTGSPTITGGYFRLSRFVNVTVVVNGTSQTVASKIDNLPYTATNYGVATVYNSTTLALAGHGYVNTGTKDLYLPNWNVTTNNLIVNANYQITGL